MFAALFAGCGNSSKSESIKIGFIGPLTGGNAAIGVGLRNSA